MTLPNGTDFFLKNQFNQFFEKDHNKIKFYVFLTILGIAVFLAVAFTAPFKKKELVERYPKPPSQAAEYIFNYKDKFVGAPDGQGKNGLNYLTFRKSSNSYAEAVWNSGANAYLSATSANLKISKDQVVPSVEENAAIKWTSEVSGNLSVRGTVRRSPSQQATTPTSANPTTNVANTLGEEGGQPPDGPEDRERRTASRPPPEGGAGIDIPVVEPIIRPYTLSVKKSDNQTLKSLEVKQNDNLNFDISNLTNLTINTRDYLEFQIDSNADTSADSLDLEFTITLTQPPLAQPPPSSTESSISNQRYAPGEVIVKFKNNPPTLEYKSEEDRRGDVINRRSLSPTEIDQDRSNPLLKELNNKYGLKSIDKIFKGTEEPSREVGKIKAKFLQEINEGERRIDEENLSKVDLSRIYKLQLDNSAPVEQVVQELTNNPEIEYAHPNYIVKAQAVPNDPYYPEMWNLGKIDMEKAWDVTKGSDQITVAVIDTGIDFSHPELGGSVYSENRNFEKMTEEPLGLRGRILYDEGRFAVTEDKIAYVLSNKIYIKSFSGQPFPINLPTDGYNIQRITLNGDILAYYSFNSEKTPTARIGVYDFTTKQHNILDNLNDSSTGLLTVAYGNVITSLGRNSPIGASNVVIYDIAKRQKRVITPPLSYGMLPKVSGNLVAYHTYDLSGQQPSVALYDLQSNTSRTLTLTNYSMLLDFKDTKVLYRSLESNNTLHGVYYLFDVFLNKTRRISYPTTRDVGNSTPTDIPRPNSPMDYKGSIQSRIVYFSKYSFPDGSQLFDTDTSGIIAGYDLVSDKYIQINLTTQIYGVHTNREKLCFLSADSHIYCFTYDPEVSIPPLNFYNQKVTSGFDFLEYDDFPFDDNGHGTHVSGTISSLTNNAIGISGVAWDVKLMALKVFDKEGNTYMNSLLSAMRYAGDNGARVINLSLGGDFPCTDARAFQEAIDYVRNLGSVIVVAAGNNNGPADYQTPASCMRVITVAATGPANQRASFSSYGSAVDIAAPGVAITSTTPGNGYAAWSGTSMAAPHVSGVVALMLSRNPYLSPDEIESILKETGYSIATDRPIGKLLNAYAALSSRQLLRTFIASFSPISLQPGTIITITGSNFGLTKGTVKIGSKEITVRDEDWKDREIKATVPTDAEDGKIEVTTSSGLKAISENDLKIYRCTPCRADVNGDRRVNKDDWTKITDCRNKKESEISNSGASCTGLDLTRDGTITEKDAECVSKSFNQFCPSIDTLEPSSGSIGTEIKIKGAGFGDSRGSSKILFTDNKEATVTSWSFNEIKVTVPQGTTTGKVKVQLEANNYSLSPNNFTFLPAPTITSLNNTGGIRRDTPLTIQGSNFGSTKGSVKFNTITVTGNDIRVWNNTTISLNVPSNAPLGTYPLEVKTADNLSVNTPAFSVVLPPSITLFSPRYASVGGTITIQGNNFGSTKGKAYLGDLRSRVEVSPNDITWNQDGKTITFRIPQGAPGGTLAIETSHRLYTAAPRSIVIQSTTQPLSISCVASPTVVNVNRPVTWTATASGGVGDYSYTWGGAEVIGGSTGQVVTVSYPNPGRKTAALTVRSGNQTKGVGCLSAVYVNYPRTNWFNQFRNFIRL